MPPTDPTKTAFQRWREARRRSVVEGSIFYQANEQAIGASWPVDDATDEEAQNDE